MDFFLDGTKGLGIIGQQTVAGTKGILSISGDPNKGGGGDAVQQYLDSAKNNAPSSDRAGRFLALSQIHSALTIANEALTEIGKLRDQQVDIAKEASGLATGQKTADLQTENNSIESRIAQIASSATYNGKNVLQGTTYNEDVSSTNTHDAVSVPDLFLGAGGSISKPALMNWNISFNSEPTLQDSFMSAIYKQRDALGTVQTGFKDALDKSEQILNSTLVEASKAPDIVPSHEDAQKLVRNIADQIGSQFSSEDATKTLIDMTFGKADPQKVSTLLNN